MYQKFKRPSHSIAILSIGTALFFALCRTSVAAPNCSFITKVSGLRCVEVVKSDNGDIYEGEWLSGKYDGQGTLTTKNGFAFIEASKNEYSDRARVNLGKIFSLLGNDKLVGDFERGFLKNGRFSVGGQDINKSYFVVKGGKFDSYLIDGFSIGTKPNGDFDWLDFLAKNVFTGK